MTCPIFTISSGKVVELLTAVKDQLPADLSEKETEALYEFSLAASTDLYRQVCRDGEEYRDRHPVSGFADDWYDNLRLTWADSWLVANAITALTTGINNNRQDWPIWRDALAELQPPQPQPASD